MLFQSEMVQTVSFRGVTICTPVLLTTETLSLLLQTSEISWVTNLDFFFNKPWLLSLVLSLREKQAVLNAGAAAETLIDAALHSHKYRTHY